MACLDSFAHKSPGRGGESSLRSMLLYPRRRKGLIQAKESLLKILLLSSGARLFRGVHGWLTGDLKHSRTRSKVCSNHRAGGGRGTAEGTVRATESHATEASRYKTARSEGLLARRCSKYMSRVKPSAAINDAASDKRRRGPSCRENRRRNK